MTTESSSLLQSEEIEWHLDGDDLDAVERWLLWDHGVSRSVTPLPEQALRDTYFDTEDWRLHRGGYVLRLRAGGARVEATLKGKDTGTGALRRRREYTQLLPALDISALDPGVGPVGERVRLLTGSAALRPLFEVHTRRRRFGVRVADSEAELALDQTAIVTGDLEQGHMQRVECEVHSGSAADFEPLIAAMTAECGLRLGGTSKFGLGIRVAHLEPDAWLAVGRNAVDRAATTGDAALAMLRAQYVAMLTAEPGTRLGEDDEPLHDMRVAVRRMRSTLKLYRNALTPEAERLRGELGWLGRTLGELRDLDVQLALVREWAGRAAAEPASIAAVTAIDSRRAEARARVLLTLGDPRYYALVDDLRAFLTRPLAVQPRAALRPLLTSAPKLIRRRHAQVQRAARSVRRNSSAATYHRLRIAGKQLRYALEPLAGLYGKPADRFIKRLEAMQEVLGDHQDAEVGREYLRELAQAQGTDAFADLRQEYRGRIKRLRRKAPKAYARLQGRAWKRLQRAMARQAKARGRLLPERA